ncbi:MAG: hypothetical protein Q8S14_11705 [Algoriphagus sp.]|uniref:hypothetical protein n=1 Tax=Algoriphagus sp. TaxID=1872435 RepID=UPI00272FC53C|nr:hypothetical protein [Algoriphagus sp.]MDP2041498.1 hypothetical protein [Algoriphagus sp.]MDP3472529.1 hypothetical protein [Algoriphagus sp.]
MHPYTKHLLDDIQKAFRPKDFFKNRKKVSSGDEMKDHFADIERWLNQDQEPTFGSYCGLKSGDFPPVEFYSSIELKTLVRLFEKMMFSWNLTLDVPKNLPLDRKYKLMIAILDEPTLMVEDGFVGFDYCTGNPEGCELEEYCPCLKYWEEK